MIACVGSAACRQSNSPVRSSSRPASLPASSPWQRMTPENTPPSAAPGRRDVSAPTARPPHETPASRVPRDDARARTRSEPECGRRPRSRHCLRPWPQTALNPTPAPVVTARTPPHSQGCRTPAILRAMEIHPDAPAPCKAHSTRLRAVDAPHAPNSRSLTSPPA